MDNIKLDLVDLLDEIYQGKYSNIQLNHYFQIKKYTKQEKAFMTNIVNTVLKNTLLIDYVIEKAAKNIQKRRIRQLLRISVAQLVVLKNDAPGVVYEAVELAKNINKFQASFVNATLQNISKNKDQIISEIPATIKESILYSYPQWLVNKLKADFPEDYIDIMKSYKERSYLSIRRDPTQITEDQFNVLIDKLSTKILFQVGNVYYLDKAEILSTDEFKSGKLIVQDASSYLAAMNLDVKENENVLDACSSPGGKSLTILQEFQSDTVKVDLTSTDIHEHKIKLLEDLKAKYSYENWKIILNDAKNIEMLGKKFDKILLDVPCTGLGVLRKKPEKIYNMTSNDIKSIKKLQKEIFDSAYMSLNEGGSIVYSTCTFTLNENTNNLEYFLEKYKDLKVQELQIPENVDIKKDEFGGTYITHKNKFLDGFYIVKLQKNKNN